MKLKWINIFLTAFVLLGLTFLLVWGVAPTEIAFTLHMFQDNSNVEKVADSLDEVTTKRYVFESKEYIMPDGTPWTEYVYVIRGIGTRAGAIKTDLCYRKHFYLMAIDMNDFFSPEAEPMLWSSIY